VVRIESFIDARYDILLISLQMGWTVIPVPRTRGNLPVFKDMMLKLSELYPEQAPLIGYANDDILFSYELVDTLRVITETIHDIIKQFLLITGIRRNIEGELVRQMSGIHCPHSVYLLGKHSTVFVQDSADFFIFPAATFGQLWGDMPDFVIGRAGYDNWIISKAVTEKAVVIETTKTVIALHQTGTDGNRSGEFKSGPRNKTDTRLNRDLIPDFDYSLGYQYCIGNITNYLSTKGCKNVDFAAGIKRKECIVLSERQVTKSSCSRKS
jgi:hypothetical protein